MNKIQEILILTDDGYKNLKKAIVACTITNFSLMLPFGISIALIQEALNPLMGSEISWYRFSSLFIASLIVAVIVFLAHSNDYKKTYITSYTEAEKIRTNVAEKIRKLPMNFFNSKDLSEITIHMMEDCANNEHVISHIIPQVVSNAISITIICVMMAFYDWRMALAMFITVPIAFLIIFASKKIQNKLSRDQISAKYNASSNVQEYIEGIKVIKSCGFDGKSFKMLEEALLQMKKMALKMEFGTGIFVTGAQMILQSGIGLTVFCGTYLLTNGQINIISLMTFLLIVVRIYAPFITELTLLPELLYYFVSAERMRSLMSTEIMEGKNDVDFNEYEISLNKVSFGYNENKDVIHNVNMEIPSGKITAIVGPSGCGKSTITRLIARFWDVEKGNIKLNGVDIKTVDPEHLMSYMSFVFQDVVLFNDTIFNNIKIGNMDASDDEVYMAAKAANVDSIVEQLPDRYNTMLGENGSTLSGGERQRISIARALLKNAPIVLLDEATASLDSENEVSIQEAISRLICGKTVIVIAHRLRTIVNSDKIFVMDSGKIVEEGTHNSLMDAKGLYHKLFSIQQETLNWSVR